eukprot:1160428-Pelagomonas_calceolata.AAC.4
MFASIRPMLAVLVTPGSHVLLCSCTWRPHLNSACAQSSHASPAAGSPSKGTPSLASARPRVGLLCTASSGSKHAEGGSQGGKGGSSSLLPAWNQQANCASSEVGPLPSCSARRSSNGVLKSVKADRHFAKEEKKKLRTVAAVSCYTMT